MKKVILFKNVHKIYSMPYLLPWKAAKKVEALKNVSFYCPDRKITCLLGPNGAGKTTIIKILAGIITQDQGLIEINDELLNIRSKNFFLKIGVMASNERSFYWRLTGRQNLEFFCSLYNYKWNEIGKTVSGILSEIEIEKEADKLFGLYSSGIKQKFLLARALLCNPDILLLDEPTSHIDPIAKENIHRLITNNFIKKRKMTILLCTHDLYEAQKLADHIILLNNGSVIAEGSLQYLKSMINPSVKFVIEFLRFPKKGWIKGLPVKAVFEHDKKIEFILQERKIIPEIIEAAVLNAGKVARCMEYEESLLEIFTRLTSGASV